MTLEAVLQGYSIQNLGFASFTPGVVIVPGSRHYSWPKGAALLGLGSSNLISVPVDLDARMDIAQLREALDRCLGNKVPVIQVVAVAGSTEESAVDPLADIVAVGRSTAARDGVPDPRRRRLGRILRLDPAAGSERRSPPEGTRAASGSTPRR